MCRKRVESLLNGPIYTPPSEQGSVLQPAAGGGPNWGGGAYDPATHTLVVPTNRVPMVVTVIPRAKLDIKATGSIETRGKMQFPNTGGPYVAQIEPLLSPLGTPCSAPPWAALTAVDLASGAVRWEVPLGSIEKLAPVPIPWELGTPGAGGPLVTAGGLVFIGYTLDDKIHAFDLHSGKTLWKSDLPAAGMATPITYDAGGRQYVVLAAGGHSMYGSTKGDSVVAYRLRR
jgi:quinoprotein glucose dehydrogenase